VASGPATPYSNRSSDVSSRSSTRNTRGGLRGNQVKQCTVSVIPTGTLHGPFVKAPEHEGHARKPVWS
jgi:hypothetical protein